MQPNVCIELVANFWKHFSNATIIFSICVQINWMAVVIYIGMYLKDFIQIWYSKWDTQNTSKNSMTVYSWDIFQVGLLHY